MADYYKFGLYYLGQNTSSTPPSFRNAIYVKDIIYKMPDLTGVGSGSFSIGTPQADGTITLNSNGNAINNICHFNSINILDLKVNTSSSVNMFYNTYSKSLFSLLEYVNYTTYQYNTWFALSNGTVYAPLSYRYSSYWFSDSGVQIAGWQGSNIDYSVPLRKVSDDSILNNSRGVSVFFGGLSSLYGSGRWLGWYGFVAKKGSTLYHCTLEGRYYANTKTATFNTAWALNSDEINFITSAATTPDPYMDGETSTTSVGMTGTFDSTSTPITLPSLPSLTAADTGFVRIYNPSLSQLKSLAQYMWTDPNFLSTLVNHAKQLLENPIESIVSLNLLPCAVPNGADEEVKVLFIPTGVNMPPATTQFVEVDCGTLEVKEYYGSALDYSPYTKVHCYLPYIGQVTLDTDEVMNSTLTIRYRIDIVTGMCVAMISVNGSVLYQFSGHCSIAMPLTSADFSTYISAAIGTAKAVAGIAAAGAGAGGVASQLLGTTAPRTTVTSFDTTDTVRNPATGRQVKAGTHHSDKSVTSKGSSFGEMATAAAVNTVGSVMGSKTVVEHSGGFTGNSGYLAVRRPYLTIEIPRMCNPVDYGKFNGYPSMITSKLSDCKGYTKVQNIQLTGFSATNEEMSEIAEMLMGGVIF